MFIKATRSEATCGWQPEKGFWKVLCRCGHVIGHFSVQEWLESFCRAIQFLVLVVLVKS